jgi:hypothetical protein
MLSSRKSTIICHRIELRSGRRHYLNNDTGKFAVEWFRPIDKREPDNDYKCLITQVLK